MITDYLICLAAVLAICFAYCAFCFVRRIRWLMRQDREAKDNPVPRADNQGE